MKLYTIPTSFSKEFVHTFLVEFEDEMLNCNANEFWCARNPYHWLIEQDLHDLWEWAKRTFGDCWRWHEFGDHDHEFDHWELRDGRGHIGDYA